MIEVQGLTKAFGHLEVLRSIDFKVDKGQVVAIIGSSGSGKSTVLRCINRLEKADGGCVLLKGENVLDKHYSLTRLRQQIGMVFQQFNLFPHMTALENVIAGLVHVQHASKAEATERGFELLARVGLKDKADVRPGKLSGGQQQRVAIARALATNPDVIMFDEPTSALDPETIGEVLEVMRAVAADGMTMLVVSHEMEFTRELADWIVFMDEGVVVESGPPSQVIDNPKMERTRAFVRKLASSHAAVDIPEPSGEGQPPHAATTGS